MNLRQRTIIKRWIRRLHATLPVVLGMAIGAVAYAVFDQTHGQPQETPAVQPLSLTTPAARPFRNCEAARRMGAAPLHRGQPGYGPHLDADGDGVACEPYPH
jgi:hypothetical protein